jgi:NitT/TauT family transport system permease protein
VIPVTALIPLVVLVFGLSEMSSVFLLANVALIPILISTIDGVMLTNQTYGTLVRNLELSKFDEYAKVLIPGSMPTILIGVDLAVMNVFKFLIIAEMFGINSGVGFRLSESADFLSYNKVYAIVIWLAILGITLSFSLNKIKRFILKWT